MKLLHIVICFLPRFTAKTIASLFLTQPNRHFASSLKFQDSCPCAAASAWAQTHLTRQFYALYHAELIVFCSYSSIGLFGSSSSNPQFDSDLSTRATVQFTPWLLFWYCLGVRGFQNMEHLHCNTCDLHSVLSLNASHYSRLNSLYVDTVLLI